MVIKSPFITEKVTNMIDSENTMEFLVEIGASKKEIKEELQRLYDVEVISIRTMITPKGEKKAAVKLAGDGSANELATTLGLL